MSEEKTRVPNPSPRYRIISPDGKRYAPFKVRPSVKLADLLPPGGPWDLEVVGAER